MKEQKMGKIINLSYLIILSISLSNLSLYGQKNSCIECHKELEDDLLVPVEAFKMDIHQQFGLSCSDCHGGNPWEDRRHGNICCHEFKVEVQRYPGRAYPGCQE